MVWSRAVYPDWPRRLSFQAEGKLRPDWRPQDSGLCKVTEDFLIFNSYFKHIKHPEIFAGLMTKPSSFSFSELMSGQTSGWNVCKEDDWTTNTTPPRTNPNGNPCHTSCSKGLGFCPWVSSLWLHQPQIFQTCKPIGSTAKSKWINPKPSARHIDSPNHPSGGDVDIVNALSLKTIS